MMLPIAAFGVGLGLAAHPAGGAQKALPALRVSADRSHLMAGPRKPFFWLADTAWWRFRLQPAEATEYLGRRAAQGFTVVQVHSAYSMPDFAGRRPAIDGDPERPDEAYWANMDRIVREAAAAGLYVALVPMWGQEYAQAFRGDAQRARRFGRWIGARYARSSNVVWIASGEYDGINDFRLPISAEQKAVLTAAAEGIREATGGQQLMTIHPGAARASSRDFHDAPWLDLNMLQSGHVVDAEAFGMEENHTLIRADRARTPRKPALDGEPIYEDTPDGIWIVGDIQRPRADGAAVRRKAYWSVMAGACGHTYGHNDVYCFNIPRGQGHVVGLPEGPGQRGHWRQALDAEGATQMRHLRALVESRPAFASHVADQDLIAQPPGRGMQHIAAARASDGRCAMVYLPAGGRVSVAAGRLTAKRVRATWFDPRTGKETPGGVLEGGGVHAMTAPSAGEGQDWVLVIDEQPRRPGSPRSGGT